MEDKSITISEMDEQVRTAISLAREQLAADRESLTRLDELTRLWNDLCYRFVMSYTGLSLIRLAKADNARSIIQLANKIIPQEGKTQLSMELAKDLSEYAN